jgi:subtilisin family serine protease
MVPGVWGSIRTNNRELVISGPYYEERRQGLDVHSYVIDTGIDTTHPAFGGRALNGVDFTGEGHGDGNGHGTHVAGTMIGTGYGISQEGFTTAVKVLNSAGSGTFANVAAGILWTADDANADKKGKGVANLSLGGGYTQAISDAIEDAFKRGVISVVAAGNSNVDACNTSPAAAAHSVCVGATTNTDARAAFSNFGCCVDIYAPGNGILSTIPNGGTAVYSGTSMAAPHIAGIIQAFWSVQPDEVTEKIKADIIAAGTGKFPDTIPPLTGGTFSGVCGPPTNANCRRPGAVCESPATTWDNNNLGYQRCVNA